ncbi:hypothetical protein MNBD_GAMMA18-2267 [hydrothermal vent metagenome]|uniref:Uncharacterized protein n=1 Tax=hydrothermal vent metagenome TaxID=652676 RepID=A0A3B1A1U1_9ZZZZ
MELSYTSSRISIWGSGVPEDVAFALGWEFTLGVGEVAVHASGLFLGSLFFSAIFYPKITFDIGRL